MKVLIGTTNPAKIKRFTDLLSHLNLEFLTLHDLGITSEPQETGKTPLENATIKAKYYGKYFDICICNDSGLYFAELPKTDCRQPGLNIRTPQGKRLNDLEMISYYSNLINTLGGKVKAYYNDGIAVFNNGEIFSFQEDNKNQFFYLINQPSAIIKSGWPLDSLSINPKTNQYFIEESKQEDPIIIDDYRSRIIHFLEKAIYKEE